MDPATQRPVPAPGSKPPPGGGLVVISGPSGVGKSTLTNALIERTGAALSISMTTRPRTPQDRDGQHYHFTDVATFEQMIEDGGFLEHAKVYDHYYGTPRAFVEQNLASGRLCVLEIDVDGAGQVKRAIPGLFAVFVQAPSDAALLERLRARGRDDEATIQRRYSRATAELERARGSGTYNAFLVNDQLDRATDELAHLVETYAQAARA